MRCRCSQTIEDTMNMEIDKSAWVSADTYPAVKKAFESTYACLGITCAHVGGLILDGTEYYEGAGPCEDPAPAETDASTTASGSVHVQSSSAFLFGIMLVASVRFGHVKIRRPQRQMRPRRLQ